MGKRGDTVNLLNIVFVHLFHEAVLFSGETVILTCPGDGTWHGKDDKVLNGTYPAKKSYEYNYADKGKGTYSCVYTVREDEGENEKSIRYKFYVEAKG